MSGDKRDQHLAFMSELSESSLKSPDSVYEIDDEEMHFSSSTIGEVEQEIESRPCRLEGIQTARDFLWDQEEDECENGTGVGENQFRGNHHKVEYFTDDDPISATASKRLPLREKAQLIVTRVNANLPRYITTSTKSDRNDDPDEDQITMDRNNHYSSSKSAGDRSSSSENKSNKALIGNAGYSADDDAEEFVTKNTDLYITMKKKSFRRKLLIGILAVIVVIAVLFKYTPSMSSLNNDNNKGGNTPTSTPPDTSSGSENTDTIPPVSNSEDRFESLLTKIVASEYTSDVRTLTTEGSPQNKALHWLSDYDEFQVPVDHPDVLQRYALAVFFFATNHDHIQPNTNMNSGDIESQSDAIMWSSHTNWLTRNEFCRWEGIECKIDNETLGDQFDSKVGDEAQGIVALSLPSHNVGGTLPAELGALQTLNRLDLSANALQGSLPDGLTKLEKLVILDLSFNNMTGIIPEAIGGCSNLQDFSLSQNHFDGSIPDQIGNLQNLEVINFKDNSFNGDIPDGVKDLSELRDINLSRNKLHGTIPNLLGEATKLEVIELQHNSLAGYIPSNLSSLKRLKTLHVEGNYLLGEVPDGLCQQVENGILLSFTSDCAHTDEPGQHIVCSCCTKCFEPDLAPTNTDTNDVDNNSTVDATTPTSTPPDTPSETTPTSSPPDTPSETTPTSPPPDTSSGSGNTGNEGVTILPYSTSEDRFQSLLKKIADSNYASIDSLTEDGTPQNKALRWLSDYDQFQIVVDHPDVPQRYALAVFFFATNHDHLQPNTNMKNDDIDSRSDAIMWSSHTHWLTGYGFCRWEGIKCEEIDEPNGDETYVVGALSLPSHTIGGTLPDDLAELQTLTSLVLSANSLQGSLPDGLAKLEKLETMHLQDNSFNGNIPDGVKDMTELRNMNLSGNKLQGTIPNLLGEATKLEIIQLQHNELEGSVPSELAGLQSLKTLHVEGNLLLGEVPDGLCQNVESGVLSSFTSDCAHTDEPGQHIVCSCCTKCFEPA